VPPSEPLTRTELRDQGYCSIAKFSDLHAYGYQIVAWLSPRLSTREWSAIVYEYKPAPCGKRDADGRWVDKTPLGAGRPPRRMTASTLEQQLAVHEYIGAPVQMGLFGGADAA